MLATMLVGKATKCDFGLAYLFQNKTVFGSMEP
jgi:hypothetical protein